MKSCLILALELPERPGEQAEQAEPSHLADEQTEVQSSTGLSQSDRNQGTEDGLQRRAGFPHCGPALRARPPGAKGSPDETD